VIFEVLGAWRQKDFVGEFLELWLGMTFFELCFGMEGKHVVILGCGLVSGISVSVRVVARIDVLHLIQQSEVVANDVLILC